MARGAQLDAIRRTGITVVDTEGRRGAPVAVSATDRPAELGQQDLIFVTLKNHSLTAAADSFAPLLGSSTALVTAANGLPWWYFHDAPADVVPRALHTIDPDARIARALGPERALGAVIYPAAELLEPGVVRHWFGDRLTLGEPGGQISARLRNAVELLTAAGFEAPVQAEIRTELWIKLMANAAYNPVSVLTGKTLGAMLADAAIEARLLEIMDDVTAVAHAVQIAIPMAPRHMLDATRPLGDHKTSMLQDYEAGRPLELAPMIGAVCELAELEGVEIPALRTAYREVLERVGADSP